ncbi:hypothetical protein SERLA73DRAFT_92093 [Serpula lacrymans var. lacrymans S7.3]|uniref:O-methyltransferase C-terminal domain-containing protein n=2 Tax=Serpula lacrymans var. lacrymans TaxID=341189 RepID=F8Q3N4_SERL3|nr:uncharacterized protein SERLADRAFT_362214 [Serpula lacrymans var. lacrymans S7.9]EGN97119.1 hypothetical protein SERLA73DRAFT_92093 [Serpula lacrymans var. lacrymans S7.3]EGO22728.1 hypothetical protein SERLADRAFT_362214 [Serpula lacrymans var. lacrymans S7.9]
MSAEAQLEALLAIINTSARQAIAEYKKSGDVPTINSTSPHPLDSAADTVALKKAVRLLEGACQQLCVSLAPPQHTLINLTENFDWACAGAAIRAKIADVLADFPNGLHVAELADIVHIEKGKLCRLLRVLACKGCFLEVDVDVFANNRLSLMLKSSSNVSCLARIYAQDVSQAAESLYETLVDPDFAASYEPDKAPLIYALRKRNIQGSFFDWMREDDERRENYHRAMVGLGDVMGSLSVLHHYPWNEVSTVCDVGASIGTFSLPLAKKFPHLKITDQDLPEVLVQATEVWQKDAPEAVEEKRIEFIPLNFFEEIPAQGKDVYYASLHLLLRNIIHDWPDAEAAVIIRNVRRAMAPHSRLLIHDYVLSSASPKLRSSTLGQELAPEPMLPNFGSGNIRMYQQDLNMWFIHNAKERTVQDSVTLGAAAGLRLEKIYDLAESSVLEFRIA